LDFARFAPGDRAAARRRLPIPREGILIVTLRWLVRRMGINILIRAAGRLASRGLQFVVAIGGAGVEGKALEALRSELGLASPEILEPIDSALLVPPDAEALAARNVELLRDSGRRSEQGANGVESVRSRFAWPNIVASLDDVYGELVHAHARP
jgi:glycosyltransferase involved in cell wall biosynthesis